MLLSELEALSTQMPLASARNWQTKLLRETPPSTLKLVKKQTIFYIKIKSKTIFIYKKYTLII